MVIIIDKLNEVCNFYRLTDLNDKLEYLTWLYIHNHLEISY